MAVSRGTEEVRVLLVGDSPTFLEAAQKVLASRYKVTTCRDGFEAMKCLARETYHVVCSDFLMPGMSGTELLQEVGRLPIVTGSLLVTGAPEQVKALEVRKGHICAVLPKPFDPDRLLQMVGQLARLTSIRRHLEARNAKAQVSAPPQA